LPFRPVWTLGFVSLFMDLSPFSFQAFGRPTLQRPMANRLTPCFRDISSWLAVTNPASNTFTPTPLKGGRAAISPKASPTASKLPPERLLS
jgi:L-lactate permease